MTEVVLKHGPFSGEGTGIYIGWWPEDDIGEIIEAEEYSSEEQQWTEQADRENSECIQAPIAGQLSPGYYG
jgi:hypothetical protein